jgi:hypothetical protein
MYEIKVMGILSSEWSDWFSGLEINHLTDEEGITTTVLTGILDQSALQGILIKIFGLNLKLISVRILNEEENGLS